MDIAAWLRELGLAHYEQAFLGNAIDADVLPTLTADDLKDIGVTVVGHRRKLLNAIAALREPERPPGSEPISPSATVSALMTQSIDFSHISSSSTARFGR